MKTLLVASALASFTAAAYTPPSFTTQQGRMVFVDFQTLHATITLDVTKKTAIAATEIAFEQAEAGHPVFDLVPDASSVTIDGQDTDATLISTPSNETQLRILDTELQPGLHHLKITHAITQDLQFKNQQPRFGFWFDDLDERGFLEQYLPSSFEYDAVAMSLDIVLVGARAKAQIFTNGTLSALDDSHFHVEFPAYFTSSSPFLHVTDPDAFTSAKKNYTSIDGRTIPVTIYGEQRKNFTSIMNQAMKTLKELEADYGPFKHASLTVYADENFGGGMEYCGATVTNSWAMPHEITHSYFGRGVLPANGNAGWIDEAIASWRDDGYKRSTQPGFDGSEMAGHPIYARKTDAAAYDEGSEFMSYLDGQLAPQHGGLKAYLRSLLDPKTGVVFSPIQTTDFQQRLEDFMGTSMQGDFDTLIYGRGQKTSQPMAKIHRRQSPHRHLTQAERQRLL